MDLTNPIGTVVPGVQGQVLTVLARAGLPLTGKRVAEMAGSSVEQTRQVLLRMSDAGLVESRRAGQAILWEMNREHLMWPAIERLVSDADQTVWALKQTIVATIEGAVDAQHRARVTAALFGSVARGDARPDGDIDVLLITPDDLAELQTEALVVDVIRAVEVATGNECNVYQASRARFDELMRAKDPMVASWTSDAAVFHGPDFRRRLTGASWDEPGSRQPRTTASVPRPLESTSR